MGWNLFSFRQVAGKWEKTGKKRDHGSRGGLCVCGCVSLVYLSSLGGLGTPNQNKTVEEITSIGSKKLSRKPGLWFSG